MKGWAKEEPNETIIRPGHVVNYGFDDGLLAGASLGHSSKG
jgi:hypothetical protein